MANSASLPRDLARVVLTVVVAATPVVFCAAVPDLVEFSRLTFVMLGVTLLGGLAIWDMMHSTTGVERPRFELASVGVLALVATSILSALCGLHPRSAFLGAEQSYGGVFTFVAYAAIFFAVRWLRPGRLLLVARLPAATAVIGYALVQRFGLDPIPWERDSAARSLSTFGHPNHLAAYLAIMLPAFVAFGLEAYRRRDRLGFAAAALVLAAGVWVLVETVCRTGWIAFAAALMAFAFVMALGRLPWRAGLAIGVVAIALAVGAGGWVLMRHGDARGERALTPDAGFVLRTGTWQSRLAMWHDCGCVFLRSPLTGCGTDNLHLAFPADRSIEFGRLDGITTPHRAHNVVLHLAATQGLCGLAAGLAFIVGLAAAIVAALRPLTQRSETRSGDRLWTAAAIAGLAAFAVNGMMSYTPLGVGVPAVLFAAFVSTRTRDGLEAEPSEDRGGRWGFALTLAVIPAVFALALAAYLQPAGWLALGVAVAAFVLLGRRWMVPIASHSEGQSGGLRSGAAKEYRLHPPHPRPVSPGHRFAGRTEVLQAGEGRRRAVVFACWMGLAAFAGWFVIVPFWSQRLARLADEHPLNDPERSAILEAAVAWTPGDDGLWSRLAEAEGAMVRFTPSPRERSAHVAAALRAAGEGYRLSPLDSSRRFALIAALRTDATVGGGSWEPWLASMQGLIDRDPNSYVVRHDAMVLALAAKDVRRIRRWAEEGQERFPGWGAFPAALGQLELEAGNAEAARDLLEKAWDGEWPVEDECRLSAGANLLVAYKRLGESPKVIATAPKILGRWPTCVPVQQMMIEAIELHHGSQLAERCRENFRHPLYQPTATPVSRSRDSERIR